MKIFTIDRGSIIATILVTILMVASFWIAIEYSDHSLSGSEFRVLDIASKNNIGLTLAEAYKKTPYPSLYYVVVHILLMIRSDDLGLRLASIIFGILTTLSIYLLGRLLFNYMIGIIAAVLFIATPNTFQFFVDANFYTMLVFLTTISTYYLFRGLENNRTKDWLLYGCFSVMALGTYQYAFFYIISQFIVIFVSREIWNIFSLNRLAHSVKKLFKKEKRIIVSVLIIFIFLIITFVINLLSAKAFEINQAIIHKHTWQKLIKSYSFAPGNVFTEKLFGIFLVMGCLYLFLREKEKLILFTILAVLPMLPMVIFLNSNYSWMVSSYGIIVYPILCIIAASSINIIQGFKGKEKKIYEQEIRRRKIKKRNATERYFLILIMIIIFVYVLCAALFLVAKDYSKEDWKGAVAFINKNAEGDDILFAFPNYTKEHTYRYYERKNRAISISNKEARKKSIGSIISGHLKKSQHKKRKLFLIMPEYGYKGISYQTLKELIPGLVANPLIEKMPKKFDTYSKIRQVMKSRELNEVINEYLYEDIVNQIKKSYKNVNYKEYKFKRINVVVINLN